EPVISLERDDPRDPQERRRAHVVACHSHAVLPAFDLPPRGKIRARSRRPPRSPIGNCQRDRNEYQKHDQRSCHDYLSPSGFPAFTVDSTMSFEIASNLSLARTYNHARTHAMKNCDSANRYARFTSPHTLVAISRGAYPTSTGSRK